MRTMSIWKRDDALAEAGYGRVMLPIDTHLGDDQTSGRSAPDLVNCTDEALLAMVEAAVDARIVRYQKRSAPI